MIGSTLGASRLEETIGPGGMGGVYRAIDTRLGRRVAIKILPPSPPGGEGGNEERSRHFLQEAIAASALDHPHIVTLYDVGREGDVEYLVEGHYALGFGLIEMQRGKVLGGSVPNEGRCGRGNGTTPADGNAFAFGRYTFKNSGAFELTVELRVLCNGQTLEFKCDPKIIVGS
jgi:hypothetical protein